MRLLFWLLDIFGDREWYIKMYQETRPKRGETDKQYAQRLRKMHYTFYGE